MAVFALCKNPKKKATKIKSGYFFIYLQHFLIISFQRKLFSKFSCIVSHSFSDGEIEEIINFFGNFHWVIRILNNKTIIFRFDNVGSPTNLVVITGKPVAKASKFALPKGS
ncbi:MAG: hypothetical protein CM1200mP16_09430 [Nitrospina sp.]|nr:MAG: hypothetical protein CM1200mP16_09430 [Nitrospina sp.]